MNRRNEGVFEVEGKRLYADAYLLIAPRSNPISREKLVSFARQLPSNVKVVFLNSSLVAGPAHIVTAAEYALKSFAKGANVAKAFHVEVALFAAATHEISRALDLFALPDIIEKAVLVCVYEKPEEAEEVLFQLKAMGLEIVKLDRRLECAIRVKEALGISDDELKAAYTTDLAEAIEKCVLSRMAIEYLSR